MPQLSKVDAAEAVKQAEDSENRFEPVPEGMYIGQLTEVDVSDKEGPSGFHYWTWDFKIMDEGYEGKTVRYISSLSPKARFSFGLAFAAFGVPADTHTDELIGRRVLLNVSQQIAASGVRQGKPVNRVEEILPFEGGDTPLDGGSASAEDF
jgi:hypothetical protein